MSKIAFMGLGNMGTPMALRLVNPGHEVTVWNRSPEPTEPLLQAGAAVAGSPADAVSGAEFAITDRGASALNFSAVVATILGTHIR